MAGAAAGELERYTEARADAGVGAGPRRAGEAGSWSWSSSSTPDAGVGAGAQPRPRRSRTPDAGSSGADAGRREQWMAGCGRRRPSSGEALGWLVGAWAVSAACGLRRCGSAVRVRETGRTGGTSRRPGRLGRGWLSGQVAIGLTGDCCVFVFFFLSIRVTRYKNRTLTR